MRVPWFAPFFVLLGGCCNGPFVYVDCVGSHIRVDVVDAAGEPLVADRITVTIGGLEEEVCTACDGAVVTVSVEGEHVLRVETADGVKETTVDVVFPVSEVGECCGDVFTEEVTMTFDGSEDTGA
jgi:hypothetical protein